MKQSIIILALVLMATACSAWCCITPNLGWYVPGDLVTVSLVATACGMQNYTVSYSFEWRDDAGTMHVAYWPDWTDTEDPLYRTWLDDSNCCPVFIQARLPWTWHTKNFMLYPTVRIYDADGNEVDSIQGSLILSYME